MREEYNPRAGFLVTSLRCSGTVVPNVLKSIEFWFLLGLHLAAYGCCRSGMLDRHWYFYEDSELYFDCFDMKVTSTIGLFLLVLYLNQCYSRYLKIHQLTRSMLVAVYDFTFQLRLYLRPHGLPYDRLACRWLCATVMVFFYQARNGGMTAGAWQELEALGMLRRDESDFLQRTPPGQRKMLAANCVGDISRVGLDAAGVPWGNTKATLDKLLAFRDLQQTVIDTLRWPLPFEYFQLLQFTVFVNLLLWAYGMGISASVLAPLYFTCTLLVYLGLLDLAARLANPYASDAIDDQMGDWIAEFLSNMSALVEYEHDGAGDWKVELDDERTARLRLDLRQEDVETLLGLSSAGSAASAAARAAPLSASARRVQASGRGGRPPEGYGELSPPRDETRVAMHRSSQPTLPSEGAAAAREGAGH